MEWLAEITIFIITKVWIIKSIYAWCAKERLPEVLTLEEIPRFSVPLSDAEIIAENHRQFLAKFSQATQKEILAKEAGFLNELSAAAYQEVSLVQARDQEQLRRDFLAMPDKDKRMFLDALWDLNNRLKNAKVDAEIDGLLTQITHGTSETRFG